MSICPICQINELKNKNKYCSKICYSLARKNGLYPPFWLGKKRSIDTKTKISQANLGRIPWCAGKKLSLEHKRKISEAHKKIYGQKHPNWKGGKIIDKTGYVRIWIAPKQWRYEHRLIMEKKLGRNLLRTEIVHHKNEDKHDNNIENLILFKNNQEHLAFHRKKIGIIKNQYGIWVIEKD